MKIQVGSDFLHLNSTILVSSGVSNHFFRLTHSCIVGVSEPLLCHADAKQHFRSFQVHYYEDGNVQLVSHKEVQDCMSISVSTTCHQKDLKLSYVNVHTDTVCFHQCLHVVMCPFESVHEVMALTQRLPEMTSVSVCNRMRPRVQRNSLRSCRPQKRTIR